MSSPSNFIEQNRDWLVCHDCGALQATVPLDPHIEMRCSDCGNQLHLGRGPWLDKATALSISAFILLICSNVYTFMTLRVANAEQSVTIMSGVGALLERNQWLLAALVITTLFLYPLLEILALLYVLTAYNLNKPLPFQIRVFRYLVRAQPWNMLDVFLLGVLVTTVKLTDKATVIPGAGIILFFFLVCVLQWAYFVIDKKNVWSWMYANNCFLTRENEDLFDCEVCKAMVGRSIVETEKACPRCHSPVYTRIPQSLQKTMAFLIAATILYIPANIFPIMSYEELGVFYIDTILSGVIVLASEGMWFIASVVFIASIVVPATKILMLYYLVWTVYTKQSFAPKKRTIMYRITEIIGRWSMVDVFVVTLLTAVVQFGFIGVVEPGAALLPFAAVVVLTMLAAESFDPRLIWDHCDEQNRNLEQVNRGNT